MQMFSDTGSLKPNRPSLKKGLPLFDILSQLNCRLVIESLSVSQTDLIADEVQVGHGGGLIPLTAIQTRGQCELAVRHSWLQAAAPVQHRDRADVSF